MLKLKTLIAIWALLWVATGQIFEYGSTISIILDDASYFEATAECNQLIMPIGAWTIIAPQVFSQITSGIFWLMENIATIIPASASKGLWLSGSTAGMCSAYFYFRTASPFTTIPCTSNSHIGVLCSMFVGPTTTTSTVFVPSSVTLTSTSVTLVTSTSILESVSTISSLTTITFVSTVNLSTTVITVVSQTTFTTTQVLTGTRTVTLSTVTTLTEFRETSTLTTATTSSIHFSNTTTTTTLTSTTTRTTLTC